MKRITFVGGGNMATSIIGGLIAQNIKASDITVSEPNETALQKLTDQFGVSATTCNSSACSMADVVVLAVKPQVLKDVCLDLAKGVAHKPLIISIAAGISSEAINQWLGGDMPIVRCMPNTPALVKLGASGLFANGQVDAKQRQFTEQLLSAVGISVWLDTEELIDPVTAVSGSGPAYFFLLMEAMIEAGMKQGLNHEQATQLTLQTAAGAATLAQQSDVDVAELRRRVTSPGGTTEQAILSFENAGFRKTVDDAMVACADRSKAMAKEFS